MDTVTCPGCGEENPAKFRLCGFCGTSLTPLPETIACPGCGEDNPSKFRLCGFCGTPLGGAAAVSAPGLAPTTGASPLLDAANGSAVSLSETATGALPLGSLLAPAPTRPATTAPILPAQEVRKFVTLVFTDLKDSTALTGSIDAEAMNEIKARYFSSMAVEIERHGGKVEKNIGDAIMAVFGLIRAHEDDALRAVRAAFGMQRALAVLNEDLERFYGVRITNRTGVNTGEIVANTDPNADQNLATGDAVNVAARLEQSAPAGEILIGEVTYELVRRHVEVDRVERGGWTVSLLANPEGLSDERRRALFASPELSDSLRKRLACTRPEDYRIEAERSMIELSSSRNLPAPIRCSGGASAMGHADGPLKLYAVTLRAKHACGEISAQMRAQSLACRCRTSVRTPPHQCGAALHDARGINSMSIYPTV